jgi:general secretion pathway protein C
MIVFNLVAGAVTIFIGVNLFYLVTTGHLRGAPTRKASMSELHEARDQGRLPINYYSPISQRNIFSSGEEVAGETAEVGEIEGLEPTSLNVALLGTVVETEEQGLAVIEERDKRKQGLYRVGDSVRGATVKRILRGKVVLRVGDKDEILTMEEEVSSRREAPVEHPSAAHGEEESTVVVSSSEVEESLRDVHQLLSQVRIRPHFTDGEADGLTVSNLKSGSLFARLGLMDGDIVQGINGRAIRSPDDVLDVYERLKSGSRVALQVLRNGEEKIINYQFR